MPLLTIPNVSTSSASELERLIDVAAEAGARRLDVHSDPEHGRSVVTFTGSPDGLVEAMSVFAIEAATSIDLTLHSGRHPRVGAVDVCPFVPHEIEMDRAVQAARRTGTLVGAAGIPVFYYGGASDTGRSLPEIRKGGLDGLLARVGAGERADEGPADIDPHRGVVCIGARGPLIAFNVWIDRSVEVAGRIAAAIRGSNSAIRALGLDVRAHGVSQVSMNLIEPGATGIDDAFDLVEEAGVAFDARPVATELVGLVADRFLPNPDATAARLLIEPGRSLESALKS